MAADVTVIEFAAKHCAEHEALTEHDVQSHVNAIILAAVTRNRVVWRAVIDSEGRASLIWLSLPEKVWDGLLAEDIRAQNLIAMLGGGGL